jgi:hypothetical protein
MALSFDTLSILEQGWPCSDLSLPLEALGPAPRQSEAATVSIDHFYLRLENLRGPIKIDMSWHINQLNRSVFSHT